jgi:DNA-binding NarL/FixJ family response regulator
MSPTFFVADDHAVVRSGLRLILEAERDFQFIGEAANGRDAVKKVKDLRPNVVIMDITMPALNGIEATEQICEAFPSAKIIILSMHSNAEYLRRALTAGARGYLLKESAGVEVVNASRAVYAGHYYLDQSISDGFIEDYLDHRRDMATQDPYDLLSVREKEILQLVIDGKSSSQIADMVFLSPKTIETYRSRIMQKLHVSDIPSLTKYAVRKGLTSL